tara:strand:- start:2125 stop:2307 length:183 start_codon:yes stop_codon:yes gene_type:complete
MFENDISIDDSDYWDDTPVDSILESKKEYSNGRIEICHVVEQVLPREDLNHQHEDFYSSH